MVDCRIGQSCGSCWKHAASRREREPSQQDEVNQVGTKRRQNKSNISKLKRLRECVCGTVAVNPFYFVTLRQYVHSLLQTSACSHACKHVCLIQQMISILGPRPLSLQTSKGAAFFYGGPGSYQILLCSSCWKRVKVQGLVPQGSPCLNTTVTWHHTMTPWHVSLVIVYCQSVSVSVSHRNPVRI